VAESRGAHSCADHTEYRHLEVSETVSAWESGSNNAKELAGDEAAGWTTFRPDINVTATMALRSCHLSPIAPIKESSLSSTRHSRSGIDKISAIANDEGLSWIRAVSNLFVFAVSRSRMTGCSVVTPQSELPRPLRDTVRSNFFNVAREYAADSRS